MEPTFPAMSKKMVICLQAHALQNNRSQSILKNRSTHIEGYSLEFKIALDPKFYFCWKQTNKEK